MFDLTIITVGKIKESYWQEALNEYSKRLRPYAKISSVEISKEQLNSLSDKEQVLGKEAIKLKSAIPKGSFVVALDQHGQGITSEQLVQNLETWSAFGKKIVFIIGGALGLSKDVLAEADFVLSFSKMTFTHQMARVFLLEQIYRAITISRGIDYHY